MSALPSHLLCHLQYDFLKFLQPVSTVINLRKNNMKHKPPQISAKLGTSEPTLKTLQ